MDYLVSLLFFCSVFVLFFLYSMYRFYFNKRKVSESNAKAGPPALPTLRGTAEAEPRGRVGNPGGMESPGLAEPDDSDASPPTRSKAQLQVHFHTSYTQLRPCDGACKTCLPEPREGENPRKRKTKHLVSARNSYFYYLTPSTGRCTDELIIAHEVHTLYKALCSFNALQRHESDTAVTPVRMRTVALSSLTAGQRQDTCSE